MYAQVAAVFYLLDRLCPFIGFHCMCSSLGALSRSITKYCMQDLDVAERQRNGFLNKFAEGILAGFIAHSQNLSSTEPPRAASIGTL